MPNYRRISLFIFGTLLGCGLVYVTLMRGRDFPAWTPEGKIKESLQANAIKISAQAKCMLLCNNIADDDILSVINTMDVLFDESDIRGKQIPEYVIEGKGLNGKTYKMKFKSEYLTTKLISVLPEKDAPKTCDCK
jgi:hypothetical protein